MTRTWLGHMSIQQPMQPKIPKKYLIQNGPECHCHDWRCLSIAVLRCFVWQHDGWTGETVWGVHDIGEETVILGEHWSKELSSEAVAGSLLLQHVCNCA